jgi:hypothetical protein
MKRINILTPAQVRHAKADRSKANEGRGSKVKLPRDVRELALARATGNAVERAYRRGTALEQRRRLMDEWAAYCERPTQTDNVILLERKPIPA